MKHRPNQNALKNWPSRGVIASHDYGCPPHDAAGLARAREGIERRERAVLDARTRKGLDTGGRQAMNSEGALLDEEDSCAAGRVSAGEPCLG